jgi:hypothetical protein
MLADLRPRLRRRAGRWIGTVRGRRLLFVAATAPGVVTAAAAETAHDPAFFCVGLLFIALAIAVRRFTEPHCLARANRAGLPKSHGFPETTP